MSRARKVSSTPNSTCAHMLSSEWWSKRGSRTLDPTSNQNGSVRVQGVACMHDGSRPPLGTTVGGSKMACAHLTGRMQGPRLDAQPEDADGELDQFALRRCFRVSSGTSTLPGQPDEGSLAMGSSSDGATSVRRVAIPTAKRRRLSGPRSRAESATCNVAAAREHSIIVHGKFDYRTPPLHHLISHIIGAFAIRVP